MSVRTILVSAAVAVLLSATGAAAQVPPQPAGTEAHRTAAAAGLIGVVAEPFAQFLGHLQLLRGEDDLDPAVGQDVFGHVGSVEGAELRRALDHRQKAKAVAGEVGEGGGENGSAAEPGASTSIPPAPSGITLAKPPTAA